MFELQLRQSGFLLVDGSQPAPVEAEVSDASTVVEERASLAEPQALHPYPAAAAD
jgi:hypothetical protein